MIGKADVSHREAGPGTNAQDKQNDDSINKNNKVLAILPSPIATVVVGAAAAKTKIQTG